MISRLIVFLICILAFISGCNSIISNFAGTHKLRQYTLTEILEKGIGDADYIEIGQASLSADFIYVPGDKTFRKNILIFPLVSESQKREQQPTHVVGWTKKFDPTCVEQKNCAQLISRPLRGLVSDVNRVKVNAQKLTAQGYSLMDNDKMVFVELDRAPFPWYWSLLIMISASLILVGLEVYRIRKEKHLNNNSTS